MCLCFGKLDGCKTLYRPLFRLVDNFIELVKEITQFVCFNFLTSLDRQTDRDLVQQRKSLKSSFLDFDKLTKYICAFM
jgi:hypothetical protein